MVFNFLKYSKLENNTQKRFKKALRLSNYMLTVFW